MDLEKYFKVRDIICWLMEVSWDDLTEEFRGTVSEKIFEIESICT